MQTIPITRLPKISAVSKVVSEMLRVSLADLYSERRYEELCYARFIVWYVARYSLLKSYPMIGRSFNRDHTTIMNGVKKVHRMIENMEGPYLNHVTVVRSRLGLDNEKALLETIEMWENSSIMNENKVLRAFAFTIKRDLERVKNITAA